MTDEHTPNFELNKNLIGLGGIVFPAIYGLKFKSVIFFNL